MVAYCCTHRRNIFWKSNAHLKMYHHQSLELKWAAEKIAVEYKRQCKQKRSESCTFCNQDGRKHRRSRQGTPFHMTRTHTVVEKADDITSRLLQTFTFSFLHCCLTLTGPKHTVLADFCNFLLVLLYVCLTTIWWAYNLEWFWFFGFDSIAVGL